MRSVNDELKQIPARVDEATKAKPELTADDKSILAVNFGKLQSSKYLKQEGIRKLRDGSSVNDVVRDAIAAAESELSTAKIKYPGRITTSQMMRYRRNFTAYREKFRPYKAASRFT